MVGFNPVVARAQIRSNRPTIYWDSWLFIISGDKSDFLFSDRFYIFFGHLRRLARLGLAPGLTFGVPNMECVPRQDSYYIKLTKSKST